MNREEYEKNLREKQKRHLESLRGFSEKNWQPCLHDECPRCVGTGQSATGPCIHHISCPCSKCSPQFMCDSSGNYAGNRYSEESFDVEKPKKSKVIGYETRVRVVTAMKG